MNHVKLLIREWLEAKLAGNFNHYRFIVNRLNKNLCIIVFSIKKIQNLQNGDN
jgi:hypothetical protein